MIGCACSHALHRKPHTPAWGERMRLTRLGGLCVLAGLLALPAGAQTQRPPSDSALIGAGMLAKQKQKAVAPDVPAPPSAWPRLERGTVFCRTQDDLQRRAAR